MKIRIIKTIVAFIVAGMFFFYPATVCLRMIFDTSLRKGGVPQYTVQHFYDVSLRFDKWAKGYIRSQQATKVDLNNCAATEWPIFGSVYYLLTAEEIQKLIAQRSDPIADKTKAALLKASEDAVRIIVDPRTGTWVKQKWGDSYRFRENVFYRMLLIMGLSSYGTITKNAQYRAILKEQSDSLATELINAPYHVLDDYPGECYPNDVLWAVAAILRADRIVGADHSLLKRYLIKTLDTLALTKEGIPAYAIDSSTGRPASPARGCANSGILVFAPEIDFDTAVKWYAQHEKYFWQSNRLCKGFREFTRDYRHARRDVDTGPIVGGYGSVASLFGIGAARSIGRLDHSVPLTMEVMALSWPTPFGLLIPSLLAYLGTGGGCLGDVALIFVMTRPVLNQDSTPFNGDVPLIVWLACFFYLSAGVMIVRDQWLRWRKVYSEDPSDRSERSCQPADTHRKPNK